MKILSARRALPGTSLRARVDVETPFGVRLYNVAVKETPAGWRAFAPSAFGSAAVTFTPEIAAQIIAAARSALGEIDRDKHAA